MQDRDSTDLVKDVACADERPVECKGDAYDCAVFWHVREQNCRSDRLLTESEETLVGGYSVMMRRWLHRENADLFMGNLISLAARERLGAKKVFDQLKESVLWSVVLEHFENKGKGERDVYRWIKDKLAERTIRYGVAA